MAEQAMIEIKKIDGSYSNGAYIGGLLDMNLVIPRYQRPYKWSNKNIADLLDDISLAIYKAESLSDSEFSYRIGTIILHKEKDAEEYNIVDGQQRIISLVLLKLFLAGPDIDCKLLETDFLGDTESQKNIYANYFFIKDWFSQKDITFRDRVAKALQNTLEAVVIYVMHESEAFQLFDSQNTRGRALDPHDLLKAYHLREMKEYPYEMEHAVIKWESVDTKHIRDLFSLFLFPISRWARGVKSYPFSVNEIDIYKGIEANSQYTYAKRASKAMPHFQISEPFIAGGDFFEMVEHYLNLYKDTKTEMNTKKFEKMREILAWSENDKGEELKTASAGFRYTKNLFYCAVLCYYDKFKNFDEQAIKKLFLWAFMLRVDMEKLGFDSVNKYAIGEKDNVQYTNRIDMFSKIVNARRHNEISNIQIEFTKKEMVEKSGWNELYTKLVEL